MNKDAHPNQSPKVGEKARECYEPPLMSGVVNLRDLVADFPSPPPPPRSEEEEDFYEPPEDDYW